MFIANFALALILALQHDMSTHLQLQQHRDFFGTVGIPSSRRIERACYEDLAFQVLSMSCFALDRSLMSLMAPGGVARDN